MCGGTAVAICIVFVLSFLLWRVWGRKRNNLRKEALAKEKAEIDRARAFLAQQDKLEAEKAAEAERLKAIINDSAAQILSENSK